MRTAGRCFVIPGLLFLAACLALTPISPVSTYTAGDVHATSGSTSLHRWNITPPQHSWQPTSWQPSFRQNTWVHEAITYSRTATFTHSSATITRTFANSPRTFSHTFRASVTVTITAISPNEPCYQGYPGCPGYPYYYTTYYQPPQSSCYPGTPGYPYNCPAYPYQTVTTITSYSTSEMTGGIPLIPVDGATAHDIWLIITPLPNGQFAVVLSAQGLQQNGAYLIEGVTRTTPILTVPIATTQTDSEFVADANGNGVYWHVLAGDPQVTYGQVLLIYLPNMQLQGPQLVANAYLG